LLLTVVQSVPTPTATGVSSNDEHPFRRPEEKGMTTALAERDQKVQAYEAALVQGDLDGLKPEERITYYKNVCESLGLNPLTRPFDYIKLNGKVTLYAKKDATEQLRKINRVSVVITDRSLAFNVYVVTARATMPDGRTDESIGAVPVENLRGEALANAYMKAETKAKRRVTLSICGLGMLDETETEAIPGAVIGAIDDARAAYHRDEDAHEAPAMLISPDDLPFDEEELVTQDDYVQIDNARKSAGVTARDFIAYIKNAYAVENVKGLTRAQAAEIIAYYRDSSAASG
jgi:hypothetical protein